MKALTSLLLLLLFLTGAATADTILLQEDFEDGVADDFTVASGDWTVSDGVYFCEVVGIGVLGESRAGDLNWTDYQLDLDIMVQGGVNHLVRFRVQPDGDCYEVNLRGEPYSDAHLQRVYEGSRFTLLTVPLEAIGVGYWHHIRVQLFMNLITITVDDFEVFDFVDTIAPLYAGGIGLCAYAGGLIMWQNAYFDDVVVTALTTPAAETSWSRIKQLY